MSQQPPEYYPGKQYQPLFDYLHDQFGVLALESDMTEIIEIVRKMETLHPSESVGVRMVELSPEENAVLDETDARSGKEEKAFAEWLEENTEIIRDNPKITLYRYCDKNNQWGNYTLDDIYDEYKQNK